MSVIEASSGTYRSRVDGTIVLSVEIEPRFRADALELFGMPGTPMALAALKVGHAAKTDAPAEPKTDNPLCKWAAIRCTEDLFQRWVAHRTNDIADRVDEALAATFIRETCRVESRSDLDNDPEAAERFHRLIRLPYSQWVKTASVNEEKSL